MAGVAADKMTLLGGWKDEAATHERIVDAPVSGGVARAAGGDLLVGHGRRSAICCGTRATTTRRHGQRRASGGIGAPGDGQKVHLVNQLLCGVHIAVGAEALAFAEAMHLDPAATWEVIRGGAAASFILDDRGQRMVHGSDETKSALDTFVKDMGLVLYAARANSFPRR